MAEEKVKSKSHYAMKVDRQNGGNFGRPAGATRARRECSFCRRSLVGSRGHGFPSRDGRSIACGACKKP